LRARALDFLAPRGALFCRQRAQCAVLTLAQSALLPLGLTLLLAQLLGRLRSRGRLGHLRGCGFLLLRGDGFRLRLLGLQVLPVFSAQLPGGRLRSRRRLLRLRDCCFRLRLLLLRGCGFRLHLLALQDAFLPALLCALLLLRDRG